jgi:glutamate N-acetyltransferase/amino-acid N-acetyltransferase
MSVTAARGFAASGVSAGIRPSGKPDVALVRSLTPAVGCAMWTTNRVQAAPVAVSRRHLEAAEPQAIVVNAGVANAATGRPGEDDATATAAHVASLLDLEPEQVVVLSTGVIGPRLPMDKLAAGVEQAVAALTTGGGPAAAEAILTTDSGPKTAVAHGDGFTVGGMAKGAGMIHPCLATMLAVVTTDYPLAPGEADAFLRPAVERSFNRISVDGDCSTNDAVVLLANGASGIVRDSGLAGLDGQFAEALDAVCADLARQIVVDGEGATVVLEIAVRRASSPEEARAIALRVATSPLVKTAAFGRDPNWGRVLAAAGSAPWNGGFARLDTDRLSVSFDGTEVFAAGSPTGRVPELAGSACRIELDLGLGAGEAAYLASDLSYDYVKLNAEYTT